MNDELDGAVCDWMVSPVVSLREHMLVAEAIEQFEALDVSALPVLDASSRLTGVLGWAELRKASRLVQPSGGSVALDVLFPLPAAAAKSA